MNEIEILLLPSGKYRWMVSGAGDYVGPNLHDTPEDAELEARTYTAQHYAGVAFETVRRTQVAPQS